MFEVAESWIRNGLLFSQPRPPSVAPCSLAEAIKCYVAGTTVYSLIWAMVIFAQTGTLVEASIAIPFFGMLNIASTAILIGILYSVLWFAKVRVPLADVILICCSAIGGLTPILVVLMSPFLYSAVGLAVEHQDPSQHYVTTAIYLGLVADPEVWWIGILIWLAVAVAVIVVAYYVSGIVRSIKSIARSRSWITVASSVISACFIAGFFLRFSVNYSFWIFVIRESVKH